MPGVNDAPEQVEPILELAAEAGAAYVTGIALHLRGDVRDLWFEWLREHRPDLIPRYERLYRRGAYAPPEERKRLAELVRGRRSHPRSGAGGGPGRIACVHARAHRSGPGRRSPAHLKQEQDACSKVESDLMQRPTQKKPRPTP